jgi:ADP-ribose pyrophosphatase
MEEKDMKCTTRSSEYLIRRPWMTVRKDVVVHPDGRVNPEYYVLEYPDFINVIAITADGRIIMEQQWRQAVGEVSLEIPAGVVEKGESPLQAAQRELAEETGFTGGTWEPLLVTTPNSSTATNHCYTFVARGVEQTTTQHLDATEDLRYFFVSEDELFTLLKEGKIHQAMMVAPLWKYFWKKPHPQPLSKG